MLSSMSRRAHHALVSASRTSRMFGDVLVLAVLSSTSMSKNPVQSSSFLADSHLLYFKLTS